MSRSRTAVRQTLNNMKGSLPFLLGIIFLIALVVSSVSSQSLSRILTGNALIDSLITALFGSILAGNPINSYVISAELLKLGVSLMAVTAFIISWVTVGVIQLPAEAMLLGKRFAVTRNVLCFISAILIASLVTLILGTL